MTDETGLVTRAREGDVAAWRALHEHHLAAVRRVCRGFGQLGSADIEDLVQETFVRAFRNIDRLQDPARFRAWLLTIARSRCLNRVSSIAAERRATEAYTADPARGPSSPRIDPERLDRERRIEIVRELIAGLPEGPEAETVRLFYLEGKLSAREIAERLGVGKSTVTMRLERFRAKVKRRLAALLAREEGEPA